MSSWINNPGEPFGTPSGKTPTDASTFRTIGGPDAGGRMLPPAIRLTFPDEHWGDLNATFANAHPDPHGPDAGEDVAAWLAEFRRPRILRNLIDLRSDSETWLVAVYLETDETVGYPWAAGWIDFGLAYGLVWAVWYGKDHQINVDPESLPVSIFPAMTFRQSYPRIMFPDDRWSAFTNTLNIEAGGIGSRVKTEPLWNDRVPWLTG